MDGTFANRAGPGEVSLAVAALVEVHANADADRTFLLTPEKVACNTTAEMTLVDATWVSGPVFWERWAPDAVPGMWP